MNQKLLTILGCSSSVALSLFPANSAQANTTKEYVFTVPEISDQIVEISASDRDYPFYDCSCSEYDPATQEKIDREGNQAIELYGCDCAGCRNMVRSLNKEDKLQS